MNHTNKINYLNFEHYCVNKHYIQMDEIYRIT